MLNGKLEKNILEIVMIKKNRFYSIQKKVPFEQC